MAGILSSITGMFGKGKNNAAGGAKGDASPEKPQPKPTQATTKKAPPPIPVPNDKYKDAARVNTQAEKTGTQAERFRAVQLNSLITVTTGIYNVLRNIHNFEIEKLKGENTQTKVAAIEDTKSQAISSGTGISPKTLGGLSGLLVPAILGIVAALDAFAKGIGASVGDVLKSIRAIAATFGGLGKWLTNSFSKLFENAFTGLKEKFGFLKSVHVHFVPYLHLDLRTQDHPD